MKKNALKKLWILPLAAMIFSAALPREAAGQKIAGFEPCLLVCTLATPARPLIAIRTFRADRERRFLLVDPLKLTTAVVRACEVKPCSTSWVELRRRYVPDPYIKALFDAETTGAALQDAGIRHIAARARGIGLTADLCPSKRDLDRSFFIDIVKTLRKEKAPVPLALAVTGLWMEEHPDDFCWLMDLMDSGHIAITWINHSFHHRIGSGSDLTQNFLLKKGTNVEQEILKTEKLLLESGALPSVFFRFPGLVSNDSLVRLVVSYGLIPVGCDAWLAKDQRPTDGSIVLVHANGNEPEGIERMRKILREEQPNIDARRWVLLDLKESVAETEEESYEEPPGGPPDRKLSVAPPVARDTIEDTELAE